MSLKMNNWDWRRMPKKNILLNSNKVKKKFMNSKNKLNNLNYKYSQVKVPLRS